MSNLAKEASLKRRSLYDVDTRPDHPPTNYLETIVHLVKANVGVGLFAMGNAYKNGGLYVSPVLTLLVAGICVHCQHVLINCAEKVSYDYNPNDDPIDYAETVELCFENGPKATTTWSHFMGIFINTFICITQFGFCCVYLVFIASNLQQIFRANGIFIDLRLLLLVIWVPIWLACLITNLKALAPISLFANISLFASFGVVMGFAYKDGIPNDIDQRKAYTNPGETSLFFGTIIFTYEGIALVLPLKNVMKKPENFNRLLGVLNVGMCLVLIMYVVSGISGYIKWGEEVAGSMTLNLGDTLLAQCTKGAVSLGILLSYPLQFFVPMQVLLPSVINRFNCWDRSNLCELIFRTLMSLVTLIIAEAIPDIGIFISLIGALCSCSLALMFPPVIECILLHRSTQSKCKKAWIISKNSFIIIVAFSGFVVGTYMSIKEIIELFKGDLKAIM